VSAATERQVLENGDDLVIAWGFLLYLALIVASVPRWPLRFPSLLALAGLAAMYLPAELAEGPPGAVGMSVFLIAATIAALATPVRYRTLTVAAFALWTPAIRLFGDEPAAGGFPLVVTIAAILALLFLVAMVLPGTAVDDDERVRRIGLGLLAIACVARVSERHSVVATVGGFAPDDLWTLVAVAVLAILALAPLRRPWRDALAAGVALAVYILVGMALILGKGYHVDSVAVVHRAAEYFVAGQDPYVVLDAVEALRRFGLDPVLATNLEDGSDVRTYSYPALSFLVPAPFVAAGLTDIRWIYLLEIVVLALVLIRHVRVPWRPLVAAAVVGNGVIARQNVLAGVDPLWAVLVALGFLFGSRRIVSPVLIGLACATRQPAWFFVPFYVLATWKRHGAREAGRRMVIVAIAALIPNVPFLVTAPLPFLTGVLGPLLAPLEPYGVGLVRFGMDGVIPLLPRGVYGALSALVLAGLLGALWRSWKLLPNGALVLPSVVLWFAWRSLQNYFSFAGVFALIGDEAVVAGDGPAGTPGGQEG
jgi:hypothetical protein